MSSGGLAPHPIGIKFWKNIWGSIKDRPYNAVHADFQRWYGLAFHRTFGRYFQRHRAGPMGAAAPIVIGGFSLKFLCMYYGAYRDNNAAIAAAAAYGQGGYKCAPVPK